MWFIYIYFLGGRLNKLFLVGFSDEYINRLEYIVQTISIFSIFSIAVNIVILFFQTNVDQTNNVSIFIWLLRSIFVSSGFLLGIISIATGIIWGCEPNILFFIGALFNFCINFIVGAMIIAIINLCEYGYVSIIVMAFILNSSLLTGLACYLISNRTTFLFTFIQFIMEKSKII